MQRVAVAQPGRAAFGDERRAFPAVAHLVVVAGLVVVGVALRWPPLAPSSLWLDDAWAALVSRADGPGEAAGMGLTAPGLALLHYGLFRLIPFSAARAQALPFAFAVAGPVLVYLLAVRRGVRPPFALVGAAALLAAPIHVVYATRVKQYTLDAVLVLAVVAVAWRVLDRPFHPARWVALVVVSIGATAMSAAVAPYVAAAFLAAGVAALRARPPVVRMAVTAAGAYGVFAAVWWWLVLRPLVTPDLRAYWSDFYPSLSPDEIATGLGKVLDGFSTYPAVAGAVLVACWLVVAWRQPEVALLLGAPLVVAVVLSLLEAAPLGGGRTDVYLYPAFALLVAVALDQVPSVPRPAAWAAGAAVTAALVLALPATPVYPPEDVGPLVAEVEARMEPGEVVLVYSATRWAYGLYTGEPVAFAKDSTRMPGFALDIRSDAVHVLGPHREEPERYAADVAGAVAGRGRVWLVASHWRDDLPAVEAAVSATGRRLLERVERPGAVMALWSSP